MATINDLVLVHVDNKPNFYARIDDINPDVQNGWWQVKLLVLSFPLQVFTWILDEHQLEGADFTMGGTPMRLEKVFAPVEEEPVRIKKERPQNSSAVSPSNNKVVSLLDRRKK